MDMAVPKTTDLPLDKHDFEILSDFRHQIRKFERFSEEVTRRYGLTPLQYLLLLHVKGYPGRDWATVGELAERLQTQQHGVVALISRCERLGLDINHHPASGEPADLDTSNTWTNRYSSHVAVACRRCDKPA